MFIMTMSTAFKVGDTAPVKINKQPTMLEWRDPRTLVIAGWDRRRILHTSEDGDGLRTFYCSDAADAPDRAPAFTIFAPDAQGRPVELVLANFPPETQPKGDV